MRSLRGSLLEVWSRCFEGLVTVLVEGEDEGRESRREGRDEARVLLRRVFGVVVLLQSDGNEEIKQGQ